MKISRLPVRLLLGAGAAFAPGVAAPAAGQTATARQDSVARAALFAHLRARDREIIGGEHRTFDPAWVHVSRAPSAVVPGLAFWWGAYSPPGTADVFVDEGVGLVGDSTRVLQRVADWYALARLASWEPRSGGEARAACVEAVAVAGPRAWHAFQPFLYRNTNSVKDEPLFRYSNYPWRRKLRGPVVRRTGPGAWRADIWMIEPRRSARYRCSVTARAMRVAAIDSVPIGRFTPGP